MGQVKQQVIAAHEAQTEIDMEALHLELLAQGAFTDAPVDEVDGAIDEMWDAYEDEPGYYESRYPFYF